MENQVLTDMYVNIIEDTTLLVKDINEFVNIEDKGNNRLLAISFDEKELKGYVYISKAINSPTKSDQYTLTFKSKNGLYRLINLYITLNWNLKNIVVDPNNSNIIKYYFS